MVHTIESFTPGELYVLAGAAGITYLFGLPEREKLTLADPDCVTKATEKLKAKRLITEENGLTPAAFQLIELLKAYQESNEYTRFNNLLIGFLPQDKDRVAVFTERKQNEEYEIDYIAKRDVYFSLLQRVPFLMREPREIEHTFLTNKMTEEKQRFFEEMDLSKKDLLAVETFSRPRDRRVGNKGKWECFLYFTEGENFIQVDIERKQYEWASLYAVNKKLYDGLKMPYKKLIDPRQFSLGGIR
ncbi:DUF5081 family protein [Bacillus pfraonensis]|uniref:DUF5081 family protein n=1 Tax=Bacillus TaxID=1386 RepID=UPI002A5904BF|nr:DUF5081 family protein [Bacillus pseudomycoides]